MELHIRNISKTYPCGVRALTNVTLTLGGGVLGLLGPTGAGKTTLMRIVAGLLEPDEGSVSLGSIDVMKQPDAIRESLGYFAPEFGGPPGVAAVETALGTECRPVLILDDPTAGLAAPERMRMLRLVHDLGEKSVVFFATANALDVSDTCSRMAIINAGRVVLEADPRCAAGELCGRIWTREIAKEALPRVQREYAVISTKEVAGRTVVRVYSNVAPAVGFERAKPGLEDVYASALAGHIGRPLTHAATRATALEVG